MKVDSQAKKPSSSSLLLGAGSGAPDPSVVGSCTYPSPNGFRDFILDSSPRCWLVFTGGSSRLDHPKLFIESRNDEDAILVVYRYRVRRMQVSRSMSERGVSGPRGITVPEYGYLAGSQGRVEVTGGHR